MDTYLMGWPRSTLSHVAGSTSIFLTVVNAIVAGTLGALVTDAAGRRVAPWSWWSASLARPRLRRRSSSYRAAVLRIDRGRSRGSRPRRRLTRPTPDRPSARRRADPRGRPPAASCCTGAMSSTTAVTHAHGLHVLRRHAVLLLRLTPARTSPGAPSERARRPTRRRTHEHHPRQPRGIPPHPPRPAPDPGIVCPRMCCHAHIPTPRPTDTGAVP